jgi:hypothetical protein
LGHVGGTPAGKDEPARTAGLMVVITSETMERRSPEGARRSVLSEPSAGQQPGKRASGEFGVVDVHVVLIRVLDDGLEQGAIDRDAAAGLELVALVRFEVGFQIDRDAPGGQEVDVSRP